MMHQGEFLFLGTGASTGVPVVGCSCSVCLSSNPKNKRLRSAGLLKVNQKRILIDAGPDVRYQLLRSRIDRLDGLFITHVHFDHIAGLDDLRIFYFIEKKELPCMLSEASFLELQKKYDYFFRPACSHVNHTARFDFYPLKQDSGRVTFVGVPFNFMTYFQGGMAVNGFRVGNFAYISDIKDYSKTIFEELQGVEVLVLSALRKSISHVHFNLDDAVQFASQVGAKQTWLTHLAHELDHEEANAELPPEVQLAYDGLTIGI